MRCNNCNGTGSTSTSPRKCSTGLPCTECGGTGIQDCCHGHEGQPEEKDVSGDIEVFTKRDIT